MAYDYGKLLGKITEKFGTQYRFAEAMEVSEHSISKKLNGETMFKQSEISKACELLEIPSEHIPLYFFSLKSSKY